MDYTLPTPHKRIYMPVRQSILSDLSETFKMTFGYFAPAPVILPVGLPVFSKKRKPSAKPADKAAETKKAA